MRTLLIDEPPLQLSQTLACALGTEQALILQQIHYLFCRRHDGSYLGRVLDDGHRYVYFSYDEMRKQYFRFMSEPTLRRSVRALEDMGALISRQPDGTDRRKYYRVDRDVVAKLVAETDARLAAEDSNLPNASDPVDRIDPISQIGSSNKTENTGSETTNTYSEGNSPSIIGSDEPMGASAPAPTKKRGRKPIEASPESADFIAWFLDLMEKTGAVRPTLTETDRRAWAAEYDRLVRLDKFTDSQIRAACSFARKDAFYSTWFWRPTFLRVKKDGVLTIQKILARMKQQGWTDPEKQLNIYVEPPDWKERAGRAYPGYDMSDRNWADLPADFRMKILATK